MNEQKLQERLKEIDEAIKKQNQLINQHVANLNILEGGRQECQFWINRLAFANAPEINIEDIQIEG